MKNRTIKSVERIWISCLSFVTEILGNKSLQIHQCDVNSKQIEHTSHSFTYGICIFSFCTIFNGRQKCGHHNDGTEVKTWPIMLILSVISLQEAMNQFAQVVDYKCSIYLRYEIVIEWLCIIIVCRCANHVEVSISCSLEKNYAQIVCWKCSFAPEHLSSLIITSGLRHSSRSHLMHTRCVWKVTRLFT